jgi:Domain of unknown function (DUF1844)
MADEKKIIIDEDWKSQVQAEKEAAAKKAVEPAGESGAASGSATAGSTSAETDAAPSAGSTSATGATASPTLPPASFEMLVTTLATEVLVALGQVPHPISKTAEVQPEHAQYLIDTLDMLRQKTKGNLTEREQQLIDEVLHQVRMVFISVAS